MRISTYLYSVLVLLGVSLAAPVGKAGEMSSRDADELVRNSWSEKRDANAGALTDPDELVRNSWSE
ncbi:MAG: hypothetical protein MMC33_008217 [Icmadophila ericetorum]|nr:hypothetical protein [Icmadophila ericetorum]